MSMVDWRQINLTYDALERLTGRNVGGKVTESYTYAPGSVSGTTSTRISRYVTGYNGNTVMDHSYTYDAGGNITRETDNGDSSYWLFVYDAQGQMQYATDYTAGGIANARYKYYYDAAGNLTSRKVSNHDNSEIFEQHTYTYGNSDWKDLLTAFDGQSITYDAVGNPTAYYDGSTMVWAEGRRLQSITRNGQATA